MKPLVIFENFSAIISIMDKNKGLPNITNITCAKYML